MDSALQDDNKLKMSICYRFVVHYPLSPTSKKTIIKNFQKIFVGNFMTLLTASKKIYGARRTVLSKFTPFCCTN